jgi:hypothetical protein
MLCRLVEAVEAVHVVLGRQPYFIEVHSSPIDNSDSCKAFFALGLCHHWPTGASNRMQKCVLGQQGGIKCTGWIQATVKGGIWKWAAAKSIAPDGPPDRSSELRSSSWRAMFSNRRWRHCWTSQMPTRMRLTSAHASVAGACICCRGSQPYFIQSAGLPWPGQHLHPRCRTLQCKPGFPAWIGALGDPSLPHPVQGWARCRLPSCNNGALMAETTTDKPPPSLSRVHMC